MTERETQSLAQALWELRAYYALKYDKYWKHYETVCRNHRWILQGIDKAN